jgi:hypothetical protein
MPKKNQTAVFVTLGPGDQELLAKVQIARHKAYGGPVETAPALMRRLLREEAEYRDVPILHNDPGPIKGRKHSPDCGHCKALVGNSYGKKRLG